MNKKELEKIKFKKFINVTNMDRIEDFKNINEVIEYSINKKDIYKYIFQNEELKKIPKIDVYTSVLILLIYKHRDQFQLNADFTFCSYEIGKIIERDFNFSVDKNHLDKIKDVCLNYDKVKIVGCAMC